MSTKFHPDKNDGDKFFEERFKEIQEAYEILSSKDRKSAYDIKIANRNSAPFGSNDTVDYEKQKKEFEEELKKKRKEYDEELRNTKKKYEEEVGQLNRNILKASKRNRKIVTILGVVILVSAILIILIKILPLHNNQELNRSMVANVPMQSTTTQKKQSIVDNDVVNVSLDENNTITTRLPISSIDMKSGGTGIPNDVEWHSISNIDTLTLDWGKDSATLLHDFNNDYKDEWRTYSFVDVNGDKVPELLLSFFSGGAHCCISNYIFTRKSNSTYEHILTSEMAGEGDAFGSTISISKYESFGYFYSCYACFVELPNKESTFQVNLKCSGKTFFLIHDSTLNREILQNLEFLKKRGIPPLVGQDNDKKDDGTRKAFLGTIISYHYNNFQDIANTQLVFEEHYDYADKYEMWSNVKSAINSINTNFKFSVPENKQSKQLKYFSYVNNRYNYAVDYPDCLIPQPVAMNNDGRVFTDYAGNIKLRVYGTRNFDKNGNQETLSKVYQAELKKKSSAIISYRKLGATFFIISGMEKGMIFYQKTIELDQGFGNIVLEYPENEADDYNSVTERISISFKKWDNSKL